MSRGSHFEVVIFHVPALGNLKINVPLNFLPGCLTSGMLLPACFLNPYIPRLIQFSSWHGSNSHYFQNSLNTRSCSRSPGLLLPGPRQFPHSGARLSVCARQGPSTAARSSLSEHLRPHWHATLRNPTNRPSEPAASFPQVRVASEFRWVTSP